MSSIKFAGGDQSEDLIGNGGVLQSGWTVVMSEFGIAEATSVYAYRTAGSGGFSIQGINNLTDQWIGKKHFYAGWLVATKTSVKHEAGFSYITVSYEGIYSDNEGVKYSIEASTSEEPIETHPKFATFAGKPSQMQLAVGYVPSTGAVFTGTNDLADTFEKFVPLGPEDDGRGENSKIGVTNYLVPNIVFTEVRTLGEGLTRAKARDLINDLGQRYDKIPDTMSSASGADKDIPEFLPDDYDDANWLLIHASYEKKGDGGTLTRKWRLSGQSGWNELIYEKGSDSVGSATRQPMAFGAGGSAVENDNDDRIKVAGEILEVAEAKKAPLGSTFNLNKEKLGEANYSFICKNTEGMDLAKSYWIRDYKHEYEWLSPTSITITGQEGGTEKVDIKFAGIIEDGDWEASISVDTNAEPIETHPAFKDAGDTNANVIGGDKNDPKNGALFDEKGGFTKFSSFVPEDLESQSWWKTNLEEDAIIEGHMPNAMAGVKSYLEIGVTWTETKFFENLSNSVEYIKKIGYIQEPQSTDPYPPNVRSSIKGSGNRNWLIVDCSWEMVSSEFTSGYQVKITYRLSGNRGWDTDIYEEA